MAGSLEARRIKVQMKPRYFFRRQQGPALTPEMFVSEDFTARKTTGKLFAQPGKQPATGGSFSLGCVAFIAILLRCECACMAYVPVCKFDIFISYAREDDLDGWVTRFRESLGKKMSGLLGRRFDRNHSIFFDIREIKVGQIWEEVSDAARKSAILVPILSPQYSDSTWCLKETQEFLRGSEYGAKRESCVAPILIVPIDDDDETNLTPHVRNANRFLFLNRQLRTWNLDSDEGQALVHEFGMRLRDLLKALLKKCSPVFLGKGVTESGKTRRKRFQKELESRGFRI